jgi:hypothetical protein
MAMTSGAYGTTIRDVWDATALDVDFDNDSFKEALYTDSITQNFDTDVSYSATNEVSGTGYSAGGATMAGESWTISSGVATFDASTDTSWTGATISSIEGRIIYDDTLAGNNLIVATDFGSTFSVTAGTLTIQNNGSGIMTLDYTP